MKNQLVKGTIILTAAGIVTRVIGFVYRIFLAGALGETTLGVYQLIFPVYSICFTLYGAGVQTAVSQMISHRRKEEHPGVLKSGFILSLTTALLLSGLLFYFSDRIGIHFLGTEKTAPLLRVLSFIFPVCGITAVSNGYFYGISDAKTPAVSQILEQLFRVVFVTGLSFFVLSGKLSAEAAVAGLIVGELASNVYNIARLRPKIAGLRPKIPLQSAKKSALHLRALFKMSLPLSGNKLVIAFLGSLESVLIPAMLVRYGFSGTDALAVFGILSGIVLPFIMFPGTLTNSLSVLLLPAISRAAGRDRYHSVRQTAGVTLRYSILLGVFTSSLFLNFGQQLGVFIFQNENAGKLLTALSFLCPFLYVTTTLTSIINGLGKTGITFLNTVLGLCLRILFLIFATPVFGIYGYIFGMTLSQILTCLLNGGYLIRKNGIQFHLMNHFVWPMIFCSGIFYIARLAGEILRQRFNAPPVLSFVCVVPAALIIFIYLYSFKLIALSDFRGKTGQ